MIKTKKESQDFGSKKVSLDKFLPAGFENIFLALYFVFLPYLAGLGFLYIYVAKMSLELFFTVYDESFFMLIWAIGYEIVAVLILLFILIKALEHAAANKGKVPTFKRPK